MPEHDDEAETLVECKACGGHFTIKAPDGKEITCRWCTCGLMTVKQMSNWVAHRSGPRRIKVE